MSKDQQIRIGDSLDRMGARFVDAWERAERCELTGENVERHAGFQTVEQFASIMTPRRLEMPRHVHRQPARSIRALSIALGRDYRRVHQDVEALVGSGLMDRDETGLHIDTMWRGWRCGSIRGEKWVGLGARWGLFESGRARSTIRPRRLLAMEAAFVGRVAEVGCLDGGVRKSLKTIIFSPDSI